MVGQIQGGSAFHTQMLLHLVNGLRVLAACYHLTPIIAESKLGTGIKLMCLSYTDRVGIRKYNTSFRYLTQNKVSLINDKIQLKSQKFHNTSKIKDNKNLDRISDLLQAW